MKTLKCVAMVLVLIGGINWGLIGLFGFDLIAAIFGYMSFMTKLVYVLIGLSAIVLAFRHCPKCGTKCEKKYK